MKKIVMTGGGTGGHVTPNIALIDELKDKYDIHYIGSRNSIEEKLITEQGIKFYGISSGKLRRNIDFRNITDMFKVVKGSFESLVLLKKIKPDLIFSKGGFVTVPVILASRVTKTPVIIHESDLSIGLANRISIPTAKKVCVTFKSTSTKLGEKAIFTGPPIRKVMLNGSKKIGENFCNFGEKKPVILLTGGSQGSKKLNEIIRNNIKNLQRFNIIHLCGKGNIDNSINFKNYIQFEYLNKELPDVFAFSDIIISRAGSNTIYEILALRKPNLLIPLSKEVSRGDQIENAREFDSNGFSRILDDNDKTKDRFVNEINRLYDERDVYIKSMNNFGFVNGTNKIIEVIESELKLK